MRWEYSPGSDTACLRLTRCGSLPGRQSIEVPVPEDASASVVLDWQDGCLVGIEVRRASTALDADVLARADRPGQV